MSRDVGVTATVRCGFDSEVVQGTSHGRISRAVRMNDATEMLASNIHSIRSIPAFTRKSNVESYISGDLVGSDVDPGGTQIINPSRARVSSTRYLFRA